MSTTESVLFANNLSYALPQSVSVATNRVLKRNYFQNRVYQQTQSMVSQWNTGTDMVDLKNSSLVMKIKVSNLDSETVKFGEGSAMNIVKNMRIFHRSGTSYTNTQHLNKWRVIEDNYKMSSDWKNTIGRQMGYGLASLSEGDEFLAVIPLPHVHPFFEPHGDVMLPSVMASGLRVEIDTSTFQEAFKSSGSIPSPKYEITEIYWQTMNVSLMDSAMASLNTQAQKQSLNYLYRDIFTSTNNNPAQSSTLNIDINKSVAFATESYAIIQKSSDLNNQEGDEVKFSYVPCKYDFILGSQHYPLQKVDSVELAYQNNLITFDKLRHPNKETSVSLTEFKDNFGLLSVSLERDTSLALSASPVNASRSLRFELKQDTPPTELQTVTVFLNYVTSSRTTLLNSDVSI